MKFERQGTPQHGARIMKDPLPHQLIDPLGSP